MGNLSVTIRPMLKLLKPNPARPCKPPTQDYYGEGTRLARAAQQNGALRKQTHKSIPGNIFVASGCQGSKIWQALYTIQNYLKIISRYFTTALLKGRSHYNLQYSFSEHSRKYSDEKYKPYFNFQGLFDFRRVVAQWWSWETETDLNTVSLGCFGFAGCRISHSKSPVTPI